MTKDFVESIQNKPQLFVGIDPRPELHGANPVQHIRQYSLELIDALATKIGGIKPQAAFFEAMGAEGYALMLEIIRYAQSRGLPVIIDAKRGDIGSTAEAYAKAYLEAFPGSALTVNPYLGGDSLEPFLSYADLHQGAIFVLVKTSNPGSGLFQDLEVSGEKLHRKVAQHVAQIASQYRVGDWSRVCAVVGATYPALIDELRSVMPHSHFLLPGLGAQGGGVVRGGGMLNSASRAVYYPGGKTDIEAAVAAADGFLAELAEG